MLSDYLLERIAQKQKLNDMRLVKTNDQLILTSY